MMMNLFVVFDPTSYFGLSLNWIIMLMAFMFIPVSYYLFGSSLYFLFKKIFMGVGKMFDEISSPNNIALGYLSMVIFIYLVMNNLMGLFPFIFTGMAHPMVTLGLGLVFWLSFFLMGWIKNFKISSAHLVPEGSPLMLAPLMVFIESMSHLIRPFTLSIRLAANMMAGHLIVGLLAMISVVSILGFMGSLILQSVLLVLEFGVAIVQGFVFSILLLLYAMEYY